MIMPTLIPIPINTKGLSWWKALWVWASTTRKWKVAEDYYFYIASMHVRVMIPAGFIFDGASIPRLFWAVFNPTGILFIPGLFHDYAYRFGHLLVEIDGQIMPMFNEWSRLDWDRMFKEIAVQVNGFKYLNKLPYWALIVGGGFTWKKHRKVEGGD